MSGVPEQDQGGVGGVTREEGESGPYPFPHGAPPGTHAVDGPGGKGGCPRMPVVRHGRGDIGAIEDGMRSHCRAQERAPAQREDGPAGGAARRRLGDAGDHPHSLNLTSTTSASQLSMCFTEIAEH